MNHRQGNEWFHLAKPAFLIGVFAVWLICVTLLTMAMTDLFTSPFFQRKNIVAVGLLASSTTAVIFITIKYFAVRKNNALQKHI